MDSDLNSKLIKFKFDSKNTSNVAGDTDSYVNFDAPNDATEVIGIIPYAYNPSTTWGTLLMFSGKTSTQKVPFRTIGTTTQTYAIHVVIIYK